jgi:Zn-dependent protease
MNFLPEAPILISRLIVLVIAFTVHEYAHAWSADWFGDDTPRLYGRLTLNPIAHLDLMGSLMILYAGFGWAKPVPINVSALERKNQYAPMWVAFAGPLSNFLLAVLGAFILRSGLIPIDFSGSLLPSAYELLNIFIQINLILMVFNLIPIFPLDGEKVLTYLLPPESRGFLDQIRPYGPMILIVLVFVAPLIGVNLLWSILRLPTEFLLRLLIG